MLQSLVEGVCIPLILDHNQAATPASKQVFIHTFLAKSDLQSTVNCENHHMKNKYLLALLDI
jgi:hypothetical protein